MTPSQRGITRRRTASTHSSDMTIQPMPCAQPRTYFAPSITSCDRGHEQGDVDRRVREREVLERAEAHGPVTNNDAIRRSCGCDVFGPLIRVGRPPGVGVVLVVADRPRRPDASHAWPIRRIMPPGASRAALRRSAARPRRTTPRPARGSARRQGSRRRRPRRRPRAPTRRPSVATHSARRPASQRPSLSRTTHRTESAQSASPVQPQRPAHLLQLEGAARPSSASKRASRAPTPSCAGEPRPRSSAIARSASAACSGGGS